MTDQQLNRMEYLQDMEFLPPAEFAELRNLLALHSDLTQAFYLLQEQGAQPTWVGGRHVVVGHTVINDLAAAHRYLAA